MARVASGRGFRDAALLALAAAVLAYWFWRGWLGSQQRLDLEILLRAIEHLRSGLPVYQLTDHAEHTKPPLLTWLIQPLGLAPAWGVKAFWDLLSLASLAGLARFAGVSWRVALLGWFACLGVWLSEIRIGQYNLMLAGLALGAARWEAARPANGRAAVLGAIVVLEVLFKPTQLLLVPFMIFRPWRERRLMAVFGGASVFVLALVLGYSLQFGWDACLSAHREWLAFLPQSQAKHLMSFGNLGFPTQAARWLEMHELSWIFLVAGLMWAIRRPWSLVDGLWVSIVCSPMAWRQNFLPLFLLLSWQMLGDSNQVHRLRKVGFWLALAGFQLLATDLLGAAGSEAFGRAGGPLWFAVAVWGFCNSRRTTLP